MKFKKYTLALALLLAFQGTFVSCTKDWLELDPIGKSVTDIYYSNEEEVGLGLVSVYDYLHTDQQFDWSSPYFIKQLPSDDSNCGGGGSGDQLPYQQIDDFDWTPLNPRIEAFYRLNYFGIYRANRIITHKATETALIKRMVAEAKVLRAYYYLDLVMCFGGVPIQPENEVAGSTPLPRATAAQVYDLIRKDLTEAAAILPSKSEYGAEDKFRVSKQTALGLLVRANLYDKNYSAAVASFEQLSAFEGTEVGLMSDYGQVFKLPGEYGIESLLEASFGSDNRAWNGWGQGWGRDGNDNDNRHIQLMGPRDPFNAGTSGLRNGWGFLPATNKIAASFEAGDLRKPHTVLTVEEFAAQFDGSYDTNGWDNERALRMKYAPWASETTDPSTTAAEMEYATNWRLLRYADVLLMAAEAYNQAGNDAAALTQLNKVRTRAGLPTVTASGAAILAAIKKERQVELAFEGQRFWDLVRWGDASKEITGFQAGKHELFPIPQMSINNNPGMSQADQNPGY